MLHPLKIPSSLLFVTVALLAACEIATGTPVAFVAFMAGTLICAGITYNLLGGLGSISGMAFTAFAASSIVISQFAKVLFAERADRPLESPLLTIQVYFVFYFCNMVGTFVYRSLRVRLPRPLEPATTAQASLQYNVALIVGAVTSFLYERLETSTNPEDHATLAHSIGLAFSPLLLLSLVIAIQATIRKSGGRHSIGIKAAIPAIITIAFGFLETSRSRIILPAVVYLFTCYASGYRLRRKHYLTIAAGLAFFLYILSPFEIYARGPMRQLGFRDRIYEGFHLIQTIPPWTVVQQASLGGVESGSREEYFDRPGTFVLSRLSAIRADSNMINACSSGFHYGFTALSIDFRRNMPRFLVKNKPENDGNSYTGRVTGVNPDNVDNGDFVLTAISDSYGAFSWLGVVVVALFLFPAIFTVYESMFDMRKPWGIVATGAFCFQFAEVNLSGVFTLLFRAPIAIIVLSYIVGLVIRMIPVKGDSGATAQDVPLWESDPGMAGQSHA